MAKSSAARAASETIPFAGGRPQDSSAAPVTQAGTRKRRSLLVAGANYKGGRRGATRSRKRRARRRGLAGSRCSAGRTTFLRFAGIGCRSAIPSPRNSATISRDGDRAEALNGRREKRKKRLHKPFTPLVTVAYTSNEETLHTTLIAETIVWIGDQPLAVSA